jgi:hypothetical protein
VLVAGAVLLAISAAGCGTGGRPATTTVGQRASAAPFCSRVEQAREQLDAISRHWFPGGGVPPGKGQDVRAADDASQAVLRQTVADLKQLPHVSAKQTLTLANLSMLEKDLQERLLYRTLNEALADEHPRDAQLKFDAHPTRELVPGLLSVLGGCDPVILNPVSALPRNAVRAPGS